MNFLFLAHPNRNATGKTTGQPQLFLCFLVTPSGHWMQDPHVLIWISETEWQLSAGFSTPIPLHPHWIAWMHQPLPALSPAVTSWQTQDSELASVNSFCICQKAIESQNVRATGRAFSEPSPIPSIVSNPFFIQSINKYAPNLYSW